MGREKRTSSAYDKASIRMAACKSIDSSFDFGNDLTQANYQSAIDDVKNTMDDYNTTLSTIDDKLNSLQDKEFTLRTWNERVLTGVAAKYSKYSSQYEQAGGARRSNRKKQDTPVTPPAPVPTPTPPPPAPMAAKKK
jgi:hypothetical protein